MCGGTVSIWDELPNREFVEECLSRSVQALTRSYGPGAIISDEGDLLRGILGAIVASNEMTVSILRRTESEGTSNEQPSHP